MNDIFKDMQAKVGCEYISDLPSYKRKVWHEMKRLNPADYEERQLEDFSKYVFGMPYQTLKDVMKQQKGREEQCRKQGCWWKREDIQTFIFENAPVMIGFLHKEKTSASMASTLDILQERLGEDYGKLFSLLLTDRGSEFEKHSLFAVSYTHLDVYKRQFYHFPSDDSVHSTSRQCRQAPKSC